VGSQKNVGENSVGGLRRKGGASSAGAGRVKEPLQASVAATVARSALRAKADAAQHFGRSAVEIDAGLDVVDASISAETFRHPRAVEASASVARPLPTRCGNLRLAITQGEGTVTRTRLRCPCPCNPSSAPSRRGSKLNTGVCTRRWPWRSGIYRTAKWRSAAQGPRQ